MSERLTQGQLDGLRKWAAENGVAADFAYCAERDDDHDTHLFVRVFDGPEEVGEVIVEADGRVDDGR